MVFLDYASTTRVDERILSAYADILKTYFANAASVHDLGTKASELQEKARAKIAGVFHVEPEGVIFTSGATEANNLAIKGVAFAYKNRGKHIITTTIEHSSVLNSCQQLRDLFGFDVTFVAPNKEGSVTAADIVPLLRKDTILVSVMGVNNEIGAINDIASIAREVKKHSTALVHCDAAQGFLKVPFDFSAVDLITISAHKIYGLKGSGALIKKKNVRLTPLNCGGGHEFGLRSGTSNYPVNIMLAKTIRLASEEFNANYAHVKKLSQKIYDAFSSVAEVTFNSRREGSPYIINMSLKDLPGAVVAQALNSRGIYVATASACYSRGVPEKNVVDKVYGDEKRARESIRVSISKYNTESDIETFIVAIREIIRDLRGRR